MQTEFRRVTIPDEIPALMAFDRKVFAAVDCFPADYWRRVQSFWMLINGAKAGCCAFERNVDFQQDLREDQRNPKLSGSLYVATTGILPRFQGHRLGQLLKCWQIAYAERYGFHRIVTNTRKSNRAMIGLNRKFGFKVVRVTPRYYLDPIESTVVMELRL